METEDLEDENETAVSGYIPTAWFFTIPNDNTIYYGWAKIMSEMENTIDYLAREYKATIVRPPFEYRRLKKLAKLYGAVSWQSRKI